MATRPPQIETEGSDAYAATAGDIVQLDPDHPGFKDPVYRARRNAIAQLAMSYRPPAVVPSVEYTPVEQGVWRTVWEHLAPLHDKWAAHEYKECSSQVKIERTEIPQLAEVNAQLRKLSGFQMTPVTGLVSSRSFLGHLGKDHFLSTQYMRHHSTPLYTPEPDIVHELVGHAATLAHPGFAALNRAFGVAAARAPESALAFIERMYWFTLEFGVVKEREGIRAYGAGLLSSFGELGRFEKEAKLIPFDISKMIEKPYDPTQYQATLYVAPSFEDVVRRVGDWLLEVAPPLPGTPG
jgi:phenylalanine-4-hydroxylase